MGSNSAAANYGLQLLVANDWKAGHRFMETAMENLHCHPHHPPGGADKNAHTYVDDPQVYAANEIAIHSNAPWVFLPAGVLEGE